MSVTVACVLRARPGLGSGVYGPADVARLRVAVAQHLPGAAFVSLSDVEVEAPRIPLAHDWPGWWAKMELFRPDIDGDLLYFDLDTIVCGGLEGFAAARRLTMLSDFYWPERIASGVMFLPEAARARVWDAWIADPAGHIRDCERFDDRRAIGDQKFLGRVLGHDVDRWQDLVPGQVVSWKVHVRRAQGSRETGCGAVPAGARVVCFHGRPRPADIGWQLPPGPVDQVRPGPAAQTAA